VLYLLKFNFTLKNIPGINMGKVDRLSKRLYWKVGVENNNNNNNNKPNKWEINLKTSKSNGRRT